VCEPRAAHPALAVRHVQVTPAADAREPGRLHRTQPRARGRAINTANVPRGYARRRSAPARSLHTRARVCYTRAKMQSDGNARTHAHLLTPARVHGHARKHPCARTQHARTQMNTNTQMRALTQLHTLIARTCSRTSEPRRGPSTPTVPPSSPVGQRELCVIPRRCRVGTATGPR
jgi:hypothetical protein